MGFPSASGEITVFKELGLAADEVELENELSLLQILS